jgi:hypothetical protein
MPVVLAALAFLSWPSRAEAGCSPSAGEYDFVCSTNSIGVATLVVPISAVIVVFEPAFEPVKDCTWQVAVDFGDGTEGTYVWNAEEGLSASHTFPEAGMSYVVMVYATEGTHNADGEPCPDLALSAYVTYPAPPPPPGEEPEEPGPGGGTGESGGGDPTAPSDGGGRPGQAGSNSDRSVGSSRSRAYWSRCGVGVVAHRVRCRRALKVVNGALARLTRTRSRSGHKPRRFGVAGFNCRLRPHAKRQLACRRGTRRILSPA